MMKEMKIGNYMFRKGESVAHSIHIDTEPKVVRPLLEDRKNYPYIDPKNVIHFFDGRANN